jgi:GNAT superfamily N-acetyltransferase
VSPIEVSPAGSEAAAVCEQVLRALPDWFGIEEAIVEYVRDAARLPSYIARVDGEVAGFMALSPHQTWSLEVHVMGVLPQFHRAGVGRRLIATAEATARDQGFPFLMVKTLGPSHSDPGYAKTRRFYESMGFRPLEELHGLWGPSNPALIMVMPLQPQHGTL